MTIEKREEFLTGANRYRGPNKVVILLFAMVAVVGVSVFVILNKQDATSIKRWQGGNYNIGKSVDYGGEALPMTTIENQVADGKVVFPLQQVMDEGLVYTTYTAGGKETSLLSYISPAGRVVAALAVCEPCRSLSFHIEGNQLVCDTCGSRWLLNDLSGLSGGCTRYPPEEIPYEIEDGKILLEEKVVLAWKPRE